VLIVFYVLLVWLKIITGTTIVFLWLWVARDRGATGAGMGAHTIGALLVWTAPWAIFLWTRSELYRGKCGLRLGIRDCSLIEFLWIDLRWLRLGMMLDMLLLIGVFLVIFRSRMSSGTNTGALGLR
jgi:hypothetical protein